MILMDRITGSRRARPEMDSLIDSQKDIADSGVEPGLGRMGVFATGNRGTDVKRGTDGVTLAGVDFLRSISTGCDGTGATGGRVVCGADIGVLGAVLAVTIAACNLSIRFSISATLVVGCTTALGFAGLRRATCSMHSTRAF